MKSNMTRITARLRATAARVETAASNQPSSTDWKEFEAQLTKAAALEMNETQLKQFMKSFAHKLDSPLANAIDSVVSGGDYRRAAIQDALDRGQRSQGTEPVDALSAAALFIRSAIRKV